MVGRCLFTYQGTPVCIAPEDVQCFTAFAILGALVIVFYLAAIIGRSVTRGGGHDRLVDIINNREYEPGPEPYYSPSLSELPSVDTDRVEVRGWFRVPFDVHIRNAGYCPDETIEGEVIDEDAPQLEAG